MAAASLRITDSYSALPRIPIYFYKAIFSPPKRPTETSQALPLQITFSEGGTASINNSFDMTEFNLGLVKQGTFKLRAMSQTLHRKKIKGKKRK